MTHDNWETAYRDTLARLRVCEAEHARQAAVLRQIHGRVIHMLRVEGMPFDVLYELHQLTLRWGETTADPQWYVSRQNESADVSFRVDVSNPHGPFLVITSEGREFYVAITRRTQLSGDVH